MEIFLVLAYVSRLCRVVIGHRTIGEEQLEHRTKTVNLRGYSSRLQMVTYSSSHHVSHLLQARVQLPCPFFQRLKDRQRGGHADRVTAVGPGLIDRAEGSEFFHNVPSAAERRERKPAAEDLAKDCQVGTNLVVFLSTAYRQPESRYHLVKDQ